MSRGLKGTKFPHKISKMIGHCASTFANLATVNAKKKEKLLVPFDTDNFPNNIHLLCDFNVCKVAQKKYFAKLINNFLLLLQKL